MITEIDQAKSDATGLNETISNQQENINLLESEKVGTKLNKMKTLKMLNCYTFKLLYLKKNLLNQSICHQQSLEQKEASILLTNQTNESTNNDLKVQIENLQNKNVSYLLK